MSISFSFNSISISLSVVRERETSTARAPANLNTLVLAQCVLIKQLAQLLKVELMIILDFIINKLSQLNGYPQ